MMMADQEAHLRGMFVVCFWTALQDIALKDTYLPTRAMHRFCEGAKLNMDAMWRKEQHCEVVLSTDTLQP
jgi:hypothetical protein